MASENLRSSTKKKDLEDGAVRPRGQGQTLASRSGFQSILTFEVVTSCICGLKSAHAPIQYQSPRKLMGITIASVQ